MKDKSFSIKGVNMKNITEKDFKKLRTKLNKLSSAWHDFKINLEDQDAVEDNIYAIAEIIEKYNSKEE